MKYLLTYKLSQDHIELFFCSVRCGLGSNNNPTCKELEYRYKRLLVHNDVHLSTGNCKILDRTEHLHGTKLKTSSPESINEMKHSRILDQTSNAFYPSKNDHDYSEEKPKSLSPFCQYSLNYIAGFVIKMCLRSLKCLECQAALLSIDYDSKALSLIVRKDKGLSLIHI